MNSWENPLLIRAAAYVYENHLSKPYKHAPNEKFPALGTIEGHVINRPFHSLSNTLRKVELVITVYLAYSRSRETSFVINGKHFRLKDELDNIKLAFLFFVAGRESEISFHEHPELYASYRYASAKCFEVFVHTFRSQFPQLETLIATNRCSLYKHFIHEPHAQTNTPFYDAIKSIFRICHKLDLPRCSSQTTFIAAKQDIANELGYADADHSIVQKLQNYAIECLIATGEQVIPLNIPRNPKLFIRCNLSKTYCFFALSRVPRPSF